MTGYEAEGLLAGLNLSPRFVAGSAKGPVRSFCDEAWGGLKQGVVKVDSTNRPNGLIQVPGLHMDAVRRAWTALLSRHSVLDSFIEDRSGAPWLTPRPPSTPAIEVLDFSAGATKADRAHAERAIGAAVWAPLDVDQGPLYRAIVVRFGAQESYIGIVAHHIVADSVSTGVLIQDLITLYSAYLRGRTPDLPPPGVSYQDYLQAMNGWIAGDDGVAARKIAVERLRAISKIDFGDHLDRSNFDRESFGLDATLSDQIRELARTLKTSAFTILLAAQKVLLSPFASSENVTLKVITTGRDALPLSRVVGNMADRVYVPTDLSGDPTFGEIVARTHQSVGMSRKLAFVRDDFIQPNLKANGYPDAAPVFNFAMSAARRTGVDPVPPPERPKPLKIPPAPNTGVTRPKDFYYLIITDDGVQMQADIRYGSGRILGFVDGYRSLLEHCCLNPETRLSVLAGRYRLGSPSRLRASMVQR